MSFIRGMADWSSDKIDLVKEILLNLLKSLKDCENKGERRLSYERLDPSAFFKRNKKGRRESKLLAPKYESLFDTIPDTQSNQDDDEFNSTIIADLIERLDGPVYIPLTNTEKSSLATVAQATLEVERQRRSLDLCGLRYLISLRMIVNIDKMAAYRSGTATPSTAMGQIEKEKEKTTRLSFRNIVWATHSESQDVMLGAANESCKSGKLLWDDARRLGVFLWLKNTESIVSF